MNKEELEQIFKKIDLPYNEGVQHMDYNDIHPRAVYFEYIWEDINASGSIYNTKVSYQVSFFSMQPRDPKLIELKKEFAKYKIFPNIAHEYIKDTREWHSYFEVDVLENIC